MLKTKDYGRGFENFRLDDRNIKVSFYFLKNKQAMERFIMKANPNCHLSTTWNMIVFTLS